MHEIERPLQRHPQELHFSPTYQLRFPSLKKLGIIDVELVLETFRAGNQIWV